MKRFLAYSSVMALLAIGTSDSHAGQIIAADFGVKDGINPGASLNQVQSGFADFSVDPPGFGGDMRNIGLSTETWNANGVQVQLSGTANGPTFSDIAPDVVGVNGNLLEDYVRVIQGDIRIALKNLTAGTYEMTTFHHVSDLGGPTPGFNIEVDTGSGSTEVASNVLTSFGTNPASVSMETFLFTADGTNDVIVELKGGGPSGNTINPSLNGFTVSSVPEPSHLAFCALIAVIVGFLSVRRKLSAAS